MSVIEDILQLAKDNNGVLTPTMVASAGFSKENQIRCNQVVDAFYDIGIITILSPAGNKIKTYDIERTLCDILKVQLQTDIQIVSESFKRYVKRKDINIPRLSEYSKLLRVERRIRAYLEVLL